MKHWGPLIVIAALTACAPQQQAGTPGTTSEAPQPPSAQTPPPAETGPDSPHIYMALQPTNGGPTSVVFAIDRGRDQTPSNDPAIRITPQDGLCNPQELRFYNFPEGAAQRPIFGPHEVRSGLSARELPNFMAMAVTSEMIRRGLVVQPDDSKPQNVCTRKLWEQLVVNESTGQG